MAREKTAVIGIRLERTLWAALDAVVARSDFSRNDFIRLAVENQIEIVKIAEKHQNRKQNSDFDAA